MAATVCVVGAGLSGLAATKCMIDAGLKVTCFEKDSHLGGRWSSESSLCISRSTITNLSRIDMAFSDFPLPADMALFVSANEFSDYLHMYAKRFRLLEHIYLGCTVVRATLVIKGSSLDECAPDSAWHVIVRSTEGAEMEYVFDFLVSATGFYTKPYVPTNISNALEAFRGKVMHSIDYKDASVFDGKTVVVVGMGNSGGDIVCEASVQSGRKAYICTDRGAQVFPRILPGGQLTTDIFARRLTSWLPTSLLKWIMEWRRNSLYDHDRLRMTPSCFSVTVNDEIMTKIACGRVVVKPGLLKSSGKTLYFNNGSFVEDVDIVVLCTGYCRELPFLPSGAVTVLKDNKYIPLYKGIFTSSMRHHLAIIGYFSALGSVVQICEMQARFVAAVFAGAVKLPSSLEMQEWIEHHMRDITMCSEESSKEYNVILKSWHYIGDLAREIGCCPSWWWILATDPVLFWKMLPRFSIWDYRLHGPNNWIGARDCIIRRDIDLYGFTKDFR